MAPPDPFYHSSPSLVPPRGCPSLPLSLSLVHSFHWQRKVFHTPLSFAQDSDRLIITPSLSSPSDKSRTVDSSLPLFHADECSHTVYLPFIPYRKFPYLLPAIISLYWLTLSAILSIVIDSRYPIESFSFNYPCEWTIIYDRRVQRSVFMWCLGKNVTIRQSNSRKRSLSSFLPSESTYKIAWAQERDLSCSCCCRVVLYDRSSSNHSAQMNLSELIGNLREIFTTDKVDVDEVRRVMESYKSNPEDWRMFAKFDENKWVDAWI